MGAQTSPVGAENEKKPTSMMTDLYPILKAALFKRIDSAKISELYAAQNFQAIHVHVLTVIIQLVEELAAQIPRPVAFAFCVHHAHYGIPGGERLYQTLMNPEVMDTVPGWAQLANKSVSIQE